MLCNDLEGSSDGGEGGREAQERRDICPRTDDTLRYTAETNNPVEQLCAVLRLVASVWLFAILRTIAHQAPLSMEFSRQECWSGVPCPPPGDLPTQGSNQSLPQGRQILYCLSHQRGPGILEWVAIPSPGDLPDPGIEPALQADSSPAEPPGNSEAIILQFKNKTFFPQIYTLLITCYGLNCVDPPTHIYTLKPQPLVYYLEIGP